MKQRHQSKAQIDVLLVMNDTPLTMGIKDALSRKKRLRISWRAPEYLDLAKEIESGKPKVIILNSATYSSQSSECLINLFSSPNVLEILMVTPENNLVQVFKKQKIMLTDKQDFTKLF